MDKKKAREILAALLATTTVAWDESKDVLGILAALHTELNELLVNSGLYSQSTMTQLMSELDAMLLRKSLEMSDWMNKAQNRAWLRGIGSTEKTLSIVELQFVKGMSGYENHAVQQFLTIDRISGVTEEMKAQIRSQVLSGVMLEKTPQQVMAYTTNIIGIRDLRGYRQIGTTGISAKAENIVRTELMTVNNAGAWYSRGQAAQQFPDLEEVWLATGDERTRDTHLDAHGQHKKVDELFIVGDEEARFPCDPNLSPKERCNCRCTVGTYREEWGDISDIYGKLDDKIKEVIQQKRGGT
jgi:uncharacterized protein with gpF-like domain